MPIDDDILDCWKAIASYLKVSEKTAMRYAQQRELPVVKNQAGHPMIRKSDADKWMFKCLNL